MISGSLFRDNNQIFHLSISGKEYTFHEKYLIEIVKQGENLKNVIININEVGVKYAYPLDKIIRINYTALLNSVLMGGNFEIEINELISKIRDLAIEQSISKGSNS
jgi:hypothetical protein